MAFGTLAYHLPVTEACRALLPVVDAATDAAVNHVACLGGAIIGQEVVPVDAVRVVVSGQCLPDGPFLFSGHLDALLHDAPSHPLIFPHEELVGNHAQLVVGDTEEEAQCEKGFVEIEYAIVERPVVARPPVLQSDGGMSEEGVHFFVGWRAGEQAHGDGVWFCCLRRQCVFGLERLGKRGECCQQKGADNPQKADKLMFHSFHNAKLQSFS